MNIEELTLAQIKEIAKLAKGVGGCSAKKPNAMIGKFVVCRTYSAGVHMGTLVSSSGKVAVLKDARRLWRWNGANSLHEVALKGVDETYSRISEPVAEIELTEVVEKIPCSDAAKANLTRSRWGA